MRQHGFMFMPALVLVVLGLLAFSAAFICLRLFGASTAQELPAGGLLGIVIAAAFSVVGAACIGAAVINRKR